MPAGERSRPHMTCSTTELQAPQILGDLTGFEPATPRFTGEVSVLFTTGWFRMAGNRRCADPSSRRRWRAEERTCPLTRFPPWRRKRHLHHRQTRCFQMFWSSLEADSRSGEQARSETLQALSNHPARALPLSYGSCDPVGFEPTTPSLSDVTGLFTTGAALRCGERSRTERRLASQGRSLSREARTRVATSLARMLPRYATSRRPPWESSFGAKYPSSSPPQLASRGTNGAALFSTKKSAPSPPGT
jgi:hypothetical protein